MKTIEKIEPKIPFVVARKRVAAYARVSKETDRLEHSLSEQISYYSSLIQKNPDWEYAGVYADRGISGTSTAQRDEFLRLMADCEDGKIDIVLTKSISRFARNTVDLLTVVRHLKELGISVRFEKECIDSMTEDGELMLTLLASFAQEESRSISENVKWGIRKRFQSGEIGVANKHLLGYQYDEEQRKYIIIPDEAEIVRRIFALYIEGMSLWNICANLNSCGFRTVTGGPFQEASLSTLIKNEVYAGDIRRQKQYTPDPINKIKVRNYGELPQYYIQDAHEAILDRDTYAKVQAEMQRRKALLNPTYCFTGMIKCGICGASFTRKKGTVKGKTYVHWICRTKKEVGMTCASVNISDEELKRITTKALELEQFSEELFLQSVKQIVVRPDGDLEYYMVGNEVRIGRNLRLSNTMHSPTLTMAFRDKVVCAICGEPFRSINSANRWVYWHCPTKKRKGQSCLSPNVSDSYLRTISASVLSLDDFDEALFDAQIEKIIVQPNKDLRFQFYDGRDILWQR